MFSINVKVCEEKQEKKEKKKKGGTCRLSNRVITWLFIYILYAVLAGICWITEI